MKKEELKKAFEKKFENIAVSNELKSKTIKAINNASIKKHSHIPYLKNFAAIFVVTMLCISIYFTRNTTKNNFISGSIKEDSTSNFTADTEPFSAKEEQQLLKSAARENPSTLQNDTKKFNISPTVNSFGAMQDLQSQNTNIIFANSASTENLESENIITSEDEFLSLYPNAEKIENGYRVYENGKEILYTFENGLLKRAETIK